MPRKEQSMNYSHRRKRRISGQWRRLNLQQDHRGKRPPSSGEANLKRYRKHTQNTKR